ncbi:MAG: T9SS type A sorting domain-containing protein, partial [bacterium]|nr:T9SS type A sorting domain-containing protein [bacterium]
RKRSETGTNETNTTAVTDSLGRVILPLTNTSSGAMSLVVTSNKFGVYLHPFIDTIQIVSSPVELMVREIVIDDGVGAGTVGNTNQIVEPGETVDLDVRLLNLGGRAMTAGVSGLLTSSDPRILVVNGTQSWRSLTVNDSAFAAGRFRIIVGAGIPHDSHVPLRLQLTSNDPDANVVRSLPITIQSLDVTFISDSLYTQGGASIPTAPIGGNLLLRAWLQNRGITASNTTVTMFSRSSALTVLQPTATIPAMASNQTIATPDDQRFLLYCSLQTLPGTLGTIGLALNAGSKIDTVYFTIPLGTRTSRDPTGPDEYGYRAFDDTDTAYSLHPNFDWVEIIPTNGGAGTRLALSDGAEDQDMSLFYPLPFPVQYYGNTFDSITVCTNGWISFGVERLGTAPQYNNFRNWHLPANEGPRNLVAVFWDDLKFSSSPEGVYVYNDTANHRFIITWNVLTMYSPSPPNEFQLIIYDQRYTPTQTHDAILCFQYKRFNDVTSQPNDTDYATIGIADNDYLRAVEYSYEHRFTPGSASITNSGTGFANRAILFATGNRISSGLLQGRIIQASDSTPVANAQISIAGLTQFSDNSGIYQYREVPVGDHIITVLANGYNFITHPITIVEDDTITANFALTRPGYRVSVDSIRVTLDVTGQDTTIPFTITNTGDGELEYTLDLLYGGILNRVVEPVTPSAGNNQLDEINAPWDEVYSFDASASTGDMNINGVEFDGNNFWATGSNTWMNPNRLYKFDSNGGLLASYNQLGPDSNSVYGWRDLAWDGHFLYSSSNRMINQIDTLGNIVQSYTSSVNPARALACDTVNGVLYYCDRMSPIYAIRTSNGEQLNSLTNTGNIYGLAWFAADPDSMFLYSMQRDVNLEGARIVKHNPVTGASQLIATIGNTGENGAGLAITNRWNPMLWTLVSVLTTDAGADRIVLHELAFNNVWVGFTPQAGTVAVGDSVQIQVQLSSNFMPEGEYRVGIQLNSNATPPSVTLPVTMIVAVNDIEERSGIATMPKQFRLEQNYPNPFNPITTIEFSLPESEQVRLTIHNLLGEEVARVANGETYRAGTYRFTFDARTLASGVYYYRLQSNRYTATRKMILMK